jgi:DNA polymerase III epsilon subunit-like protein
MTSPATPAPSLITAATQAYLDQTSKDEEAHGAVRDAVRTASSSVAALLRQVATKNDLFFQSQLDETNPNVKALQYETQDKLKTVQRLAGDLQTATVGLLRVLGEQEDLDARFADACAAPRPKE